MLVDNPTRHKLDPQWTGPWVVQKVIDTTSVRVKKDAREQVVHINRVRPLLQEDSSIEECRLWSPPLFTHIDSAGEEEVAVDNSHPDVRDAPSTTRTTRSGRVIRPVDYFGY